MQTETEQHIARIKAKVAEFYDQQQYSGWISRVGTIDDFKEWRQHVIECGTSILCTKWQVGYPGGSFAQAVANNDLMGAFATADHINQDAIKFYCSLMYNTGFIA